MRLASTLFTSSWFWSCLGLDIVLPPPPFFYHKGNWTYTAPVEGITQFGHLLYTSPMGKNCSQTLTIVVPAKLCRAPLVSNDYSSQPQCSADSLEMQTLMVDAVNARPNVLNDTCVQLSTFQYDYAVQVPNLGGPTMALQEHLHFGAKKHGIVAFQMSNTLSSVATSVGLPYIEAADKASVMVDFSNGKLQQTTYRIRTDSSWMFPGILKALLPASFAVIYEEESAASMAPIFETAAANLNRTAALSAIVSTSPPKRASEQHKKFLQALVKNRLRYVLILSSNFAVPAQLGCEIYRAGLIDYVQVVYLGGMTDIGIAWPQTTCIGDPSIKLDNLLENGGFISVGQSFLLGVEHDLLINTISGTAANASNASFDLMGRPWTLPGLDVRNSSSPECADDPSGVNTSVVLRAALLRQGTITCDDVVPLGQSFTFGYIYDVAKLCPVTACLYNRLSSACRISTCCKGANCTTADKLPQFLAAPILRCEGKTCRKLAWSASSVANSQMALGFIDRGFCQLPCTRSPILALSHLVLSHPTGDGVWALTEAFICIEQRYGSTGLARLAQYSYHDAWVAEKLRSCMEESVEFEGATGRINFKYYHSPTPGFQASNIQQYSSASGSITIIGLVTPDDGLVTHRTFFRLNYSNCVGSRSFVPPSRICPPNSSLDFVLSEASTSSILRRRLAGASTIKASSLAFSALPQGSPMNCPLGQSPLPFSESADPLRQDAFHCVPCAAGTYKDHVGQDLCTPCVPGYFSGLGQEKCSACSKNNYSSISNVTKTFSDGRTQVFGAPSCTNCFAGHVSDRAAANCSACPVGTSRNESSSSCDICDAGRYQSEPGKSECLDCNEVLLGSQSLRGAKNASECVCGPGTFKQLGQCVPCFEGLSCPGGVDLPRQAAGYFVEVLDAQQRTFSVYACRNKLQCLEGSFGLCGFGRTGLSCSKCIDGYTEHGYGECAECTSGDRAPFLGALVAIVLIGIVFIVLWKVDLTKQRLSHLTILLTAGQLVAALQALTAIRQLQIEWQEPVTSFLKALSFFTLDFRYFKLSCVIGRDSILTGFICKLVSYPFLLVTIACGYLFAKLVRRPVSFDDVCNLNGTILFTLFITISLALLVPLQCLINPNGTMSMAEDPGTVCWQSDNHKVLATLSIIGLLIYPATILSWCFCVTITYPAKIASGAGLKLNLRYNFLFGRFRAERYFYGILLLMRNFIIALMPVIFANANDIQVVAMGAVILLGFALQAVLWPWRTDAANLSDIGISFSLILILLGAAPLLSTSNTQVLANIIFAIIVILLLGCLLMILYSIYVRFIPPRYFGAFLCHHKAGAGVLCRFIKMRSCHHTSSLLFLDSDELESLDLIFDTVRNSTKVLISVLSPELLHRMWCAGEMVSAHRNDIKIVPLICDGFEMPDDEHINSIPSLWTDEQINTLMSFGISTDMVKEAYHFIRSLEPMSMPRFGSFSDQEKVIKELMSRCNLTTRFQAALSSGVKQKEPTILITGNSSDAESLSCLYVIQSLVQTILQQEACVVRSADDVVEVLDSAVYLLVLFTKGLLSDPNFVEILLILGEGGANCIEIVTVISDTGFQFPDSSFYSEVEFHGLGSPGLGPEQGPAIVKVVRSLCNVLALPLSPMGSQGLLEKQVSEICRRFRKLGQKDGVVRPDLNSLTNSAMRVKASALKKSKEQEGVLVNV